MPLKQLFYSCLAMQPFACYPNGNDMKTQLKPRKKKDAGGRRGPGVPGQERRHPSTGEAERSGTQREPESPGSPSREEVISNYAAPVTNQDEQDKITNAADIDSPVPDK